MLLFEPELIDMNLRLNEGLNPCFSGCYSLSLKSVDNMVLLLMS